MKGKTIQRSLISAGALGLLAAQFLSPGLRLEPAALGLVAIAVLPWLSSILDSAKFGDVELKFREVEREQYLQRKDLDLITKFLVEAFVTEHELTHLEKLAARTPFPFARSDSFETELRRLASLGMIERRPGRGFRTLFRENDDVQRHFEISRRGIEYLAHRRAIGKDEASS